MSENKENQPKTWWKRKEFWGAVGYVLSSGAMMFAPEYTIVYKLGYLISTALVSFGIVKGVKANNLKLSKENYKL